MVTNPNCGKHTPNKCYRKHISVLDEVIKEGKQKEEEVFAAERHEDLEGLDEKREKA